MSSKTRKNLIKTANALEKIANVLVEALTISLVIIASILVFTVELIITGKAKRVKLSKRAPRPRQTHQQTVIYRQIIPRPVLVDKQQ